MKEWISVEDKLPEEKNNQSVIVDVWIENERWPNCYYDFNAENWNDIDCGIIVDNVTHWMPLPEPPND